MLSMILRTFYVHVKYQIDVNDSKTVCYIPLLENFQHKLAVIYSMVDINIDSHKNLDLYLL